MRLQPKSPPASIERKPEGFRVEVEIELITRLFGGGENPRELDSVSWLRFSAAKSAIRGWWRAGHAYHFPSLDALREAEKLLFGASGRFDARRRPIDGPGEIQLTVKANALEGAAYEEPQESPLNGAYFPAMRMRSQPAALLAHPSNSAVARLRLSARSRSIADGLEEALREGLRLWITLGGVGARTRRGAGAIAVTSGHAAEALGLPASRDGLGEFLQARCTRHEVAPALDGVFCLARTRSIYLGKPGKSGEEAQRALLGAMRDARQDRPHPQSWSGRKDWGQSRWPEGDAIRLKAIRQAPRNGWRHHPRPENANRYPRAALGLPIVLHYQPPQEPEDHHVLGAIPAPGGWTKLDRYASPVLLRPVRVWEGERAIYVPVAIFTECTLPAGARPLVTTRPKDRLEEADVVTDHEIRRHSDATLSRLEDAFSKQGFMRLES